MGKDGSPGIRESRILGFISYFPWVFIFLCLFSYESQDTTKIFHFLLFSFQYYLHLPISRFPGLLVIFKSSVGILSAEKEKGKIRKRQRKRTADNKIK
jgi:hypothetical protein